MNKNLSTKSQDQLVAHAYAFIKKMADDKKYSKAKIDVKRRLELITREIRETGTYTHTQEELSFGAQWAWRASNRCIGRQLWRSLRVRDCRDAQTHAQVIDHLHQHIEHAWHGGEIQSVISVFAPRSADGSDPVRLGNHQLLRYAGFKETGGGYLGDPHSVPFTQSLIERGWEPTQRTAHTPLPWSIWIKGVTQYPVDHFAAHPTLFPEVKITHPDHPKIESLDLRWYAIPIISDMALVIGGIVYPCAPFNGWYMGTEIAARNLCDSTRYDLLTPIAQAMDLDTSSERTLWRDLALIKINQALLHSFDSAGVRIGDHHELCGQFERFYQVEEQAGRPLRGDWSWLVPPISGCLSPQFYRDFDNTLERDTNFFYQDPPSSSAHSSDHRDAFHLNFQGREAPQRGCPFGFDRVRGALSVFSAPLLNRLFKRR